MGLSSAVLLGGLACQLCAWATFLIIGAHFGPEVARISVVIVDAEPWLRPGAAGEPELSLAPGEFTLRLGARTLATGADPSALDRARLAQLVKARPRVFVAPRDGVTLERIVAAVDAMVGLGFEEVALDAEPR
jgi:hypothetical protein